MKLDYLVKELGPEENSNYEIQIMEGELVYNVNR
jgi:hypothetical protein